MNSTGGMQTKIISGINDGLMYTCMAPKYIHWRVNYDSCILGMKTNWKVIRIFRISYAMITLCVQCTSPFPLSLSLSLSSHIFCWVIQPGFKQHPRPNSCSQNNLQNQTLLRNGWVDRWCHDAKFDTHAYDSYTT